MMKKTQIILVLILFFSAFLRFYKLSEYPVGFHIDEASLGYNFYSLLKTARDENNQFLPLHIDMFGDQRPAGYQYLDILPVKFFGLTEFATRLPSAFFGALTPLVIFLLMLVLFKKESLALLAAGLIAISPWHLVISRASAETIVALFFVVLGAYFFVLAFKGEKKHFFSSTFFWVLSFFFYHSSRVFVPMLAIVFSVFFYPLWKQQTKAYKRNLYLSVLILCFFSFFLIFAWNFGYFHHQYFVHTRLHRPWYRFNGFKQMDLAVDQLMPDYDKVVVSKTQGGTYMHFLFFQRFDPEKYQKLGSPKDQDFSGFDKLIFVPQQCPTQLPSEIIKPGDKVLYVANGSCEDPVFSPTRKIEREDGTIVFKIYSGRSNGKTE